MRGAGTILHREKRTWRFHWVLLIPALYTLVGSVLTFAGVLPKSSPGIGVMLAALGVFFTALWATLLALRIVVSERQVTVQYGLWGPTLQVADIVECKAIDYDWTRFGGWGIRRSFDGTWAYSLMGDGGRAVEIAWRDGDKVKVGDAELTWHAVDTALYNVNLFHFARELGKNTSNVLFWAVTVVNAPKDMSGVRLAIGSNAASVWWVNGQEVIGIYGDRQTVIDDGVSKRITLKKGPNLVRAAIVNGGGATDFCARFLDADDRPIRTITASLTEVGK